MSKHTPEIHLAATCTICGTTGYEANSPCPLHAAAPDLLAALEELLTPCPPLTHEVGPDGECPACPVEERARAAIAAAKPDSPHPSAHSTCDQVDGFQT